MMATFIELVTEMAALNDIEMKSSADIDYGLLNINLLNQQSSRLTKDRIQTFLDGEESEVASIVLELGVDELDSVLDRIFDGDLHYNFFM